MFYPATIAAIRPEAEDLYSLAVSLRRPDLAASHHTPGQYAYLRLPDFPQAPFAIASPPGAEVWEFLVKRGSGISQALIASSPGEALELSPARGPGFPLRRARGHRVLLFATGSGISPIRSAIQAIRQERSAYGEVMLFFGARTPQGFAYLQEQREWEAEGIQVFCTVSQPGGSGWTGLTGHVQRHLSELGHQDDVVFLCGQEEMVAAVKEELVKRGVLPDHLFLNL